MATVEWNLLLYLAADYFGLGGAADAIVADVTAANASVKSKDVNILVECVKPKLPAQTLPDGTRTTLVAGTSSSQIVPKVDTGSEDALRDFLGCRSQFPAKRTALFIFGHGNGVADDAPLPLPPNPAQRIGANLEGDALTIPKLGSALSNAPGGPIDVFGMNACQMSTIEVVYEIRSSVSYTVASMIEEAAMGWSYGKIFERLAKKPTMANEDFVGILLDEYKKNANPPGAVNPRELAGVRSNRLEAIAQTMKSVVHQLDLGDRNAIASAVQSMMPADLDCVDLRSFFVALKNKGFDVGDGVAQIAAAIVPPVVKVNGVADVCGLSLYFPQADRSQLGAYRKISFPTLTGWADFLDGWVPKPPP